MRSTPSTPKRSRLKTLEPRRIELDRNLWTDPYQRQERFMRNSITEDLGEFGKVGAETSFPQSLMHSDYDLAESIADSDLEDGELRKMLASPLYMLNREDCESSRMPIAPVELAALFSLGSEHPQNSFNSSVFKNADPLNLGRSLLEGNNDHFAQSGKSWNHDARTPCCVSQ